MSFLTLKEKAFGLDISDLSLRIVQLKEKKNPFLNKKKGHFLELSSWGEEKIKPGIIIDGEIKDENILAEIIRKAVSNVKGKRIKTKNVVASLPEKKSFLQVIQMPKMEKKELELAIRFEAENYIPLSIEEVYLDFQTIPSFKKHSDQLSVLIAALPKKITDSYVSVLKKAGLVPRVLEIESQSIVRALVKNNVSPFPILIIDFGKSNTGFIIFSKNSLRFTSSISLGSRELDEAISQKFKISLKEAEKLKIKHGLLKKGKEGKKVFEVLEPFISNLIRQIKKHLNYYQTHAGSGSVLGGAKIEKIILCGEASNLKGFREKIFSVLKISTEFGNPWVNILPEPLNEVPQLPFKKSLGYVTALGLALRGVRGEDFLEI